MYRNSNPVNKAMSVYNENSTGYLFNSGFGRLCPGFKLKRLPSKGKNKSIDISFSGRSFLLEPVVITFRFVFVMHNTLPLKRTRSASFFSCLHPCWCIFVQMVHRKRRMSVLWYHCCESCAGRIHILPLHLSWETDCSGLGLVNPLFQLRSNAPSVSAHVNLADYH